MSEKKNNEGKNLGFPKKILVIGDWVIDEHWVTGIHRSPTSSRTGESHRRALHLLNSTTQSFCGAGQTACILHQAIRRNEKNFCEIVGVGIWHKKDTDTLATMLDPSVAKGETPHKVIREPAEDGSAVDRLFNLGDLLKDEHGTTRVMRIYQHTGSEIDLIQRLDWEIVPKDRSFWISDKEVLQNSPLDEFLNTTTFDAVVIKDLCKGVISQEIVNWLANKNGLKKIPWFVSSKEWKPNWFKALPKKIKLLLIPQVASKMAIRMGFLHSWLTKSGYLSKEAFDILDELAVEFNDKPLIVVLPDGLSILARDQKRNSRDGWRQTDSEIHPLAVGMPMASVFFPALIANLLNKEDQSLEELLKKALNFTNKWMDFEVGRITEPASWTPKEEPKIIVDYYEKTSKVGNWESFKWDVSEREWKQAFSDQGIILKNGKKTIELQRSMTEVDGYVCIVNSKRKKLRKLLHELEAFRSKRKKHPISCMLIDSPGSGKTYLVRCISKFLKMHYLPFNITQMLSKSDILDCFDTIVTTQARNRGEPILVFFDEINATLETQQVYDTFLAPLEEGLYIRAGKAFYIDPCVWVFAGTERPVNEDNPLRNSFTKASDFESRLTIEDPLDLKIDLDNNEETSEARLEKVYLGVCLLRTVFPDVRRISEKVLHLFHLLSPDLEVRKVKHFVKSFINIQYGNVLSRNVPIDWLQKHEGSIDTGEWNQKGEGDLVDIIG